MVIAVENTYCSPFDAAIRLYEHRARVRVDHVFRLKEKQKARFREVVGEWGLDPVRVVKSVFDRMDSERCLLVFGIPYPPIEFAYSRHFLTSVGVEVDVGGDLVSAEHFMEMATDAAIFLALENGGLSAGWASAVLYLKEKHPKYEIVKCWAESSGVTGDSGLGRGLDKIRKGQDG